MNAILLKVSFDMIVPHKDAFAHSFYERLFIGYPQTQPLFAQTNMRGQVGALLATLATVVAGVLRGDKLVPMLQKLGQRHKTYGVTAEHYTCFRAVLLETFQHYLGPRFTPDMQQAWEEAFEMISTQMLGGAGMLSPQEERVSVASISGIYSHSPLYKTAKVVLWLLQCRCE